MNASRKSYLVGEVSPGRDPGPKPREDSELGICPECLQTNWFTWFERSDPDGCYYEVGVIAVHADFFGFQRCRGSGEEPLTPMCA